MLTKLYYVYILTNKKNGTFYTGVTNNLVRRVWEHKEELVDGFTKKYKLKILVYFEEYNNINYALQREKTIKKWKQAIKINAIERINPKWEDLYQKLRFC